MLKPYLLIFDVMSGNRQDILNYIDTCPEVKNWYAFIPTGIIIISDKTAHDLQAMFLRKYPGRFSMITEITRGNNNGWLNKEVWDFINNPKSSGRWM